MNPIKIRYRLGRPSGKVETFIFELREVEKGALEQLRYMKLLSRDLWTGLQDKNGVDIFAGDIVRRWTTSRTGTHPNNAHVRPVEYKYTERYSGFRVAAPETLEIIGTVYANADLLEGEK